MRDVSRYYLNVLPTFVCGVIHVYGNFLVYEAVLLDSGRGRPSLWNMDIVPSLCSWFSNIIQWQSGANHRPVDLVDIRESVGLVTASSFIILREFGLCPTTSLGSSIEVSILMRHFSVITWLYAASFVSYLSPLSCWYTNYLVVIRVRMTSSLAIVELSLLWVGSW